MWIVFSPDSLACVFTASVLAPPGCMSKFPAYLPPPDAVTPCVECTFNPVGTSSVTSSTYVSAFAKELSQKMSIFTFSPSATASLSILRPILGGSGIAVGVGVGVGVGV